MPRIATLCFACSLCGPLTACSPAGWLPRVTLQGRCWFRDGASKRGQQLAAHLTWQSTLATQPTDDDAVDLHDRTPTTGAIASAASPTPCAIAALCDWELSARRDALQTLRDAQAQEHDPTLSQGDPP